MRILITGICGFVGSTLARGLREGWPDWEIVGLDNLVRAGSETNRRALRERGVKLYHGDVRNPSDLETLPRCDWIIEAAANPSVLAGVDGKTSSRQLIEHNLVGTINMLELLKHWRCGFTILSTSRVYSIRALAAIPVEIQGDRFVPSAPTTPPREHATRIRLRRSPASARRASPRNSRPSPPCRSTAAPSAPRNSSPANMPRASICPCPSSAAACWPARASLARLTRASFPFGFTPGAAGAR